MKFERVEEYFRGGWGIFRRVLESLKGCEECFGGFYKTERGLKNFGGAREGTKKARRRWEGTEESQRGIPGGAVREDRVIISRTKSVGISYKTEEKLFQFTNIPMAFDYKRVRWQKSHDWISGHLGCHISKII